MGTAFLASLVGKFHTSRRLSESLSSDRSVSTSARGSADERRPSKSDDAGSNPAGRIIADASYCEELGIAGVAFCYEDGRLLGTEIVEAKNPNHAEALSVLRCTSFIAARHLPPGQVVLTDSLMTVRCLAGHNSGEQFFMSVISDLRRFQAHRGFEVQHVPRQVVRRAHSAAWHVLRAWKIGAGHKESWKRPRHAILADRSKLNATDSEQAE